MGKRVIAGSKGWLLAALALVMGTAALPVMAQTLALNFTGPANYTPGVAYAAGVSGDYSLTITNSGATTWTGRSLTTNFPAGVTLAWTCTSAGGASCAAGSGNGNLNQTTNSIPQNGSISFAFEASYAATLTQAPLVITATARESTGPNVDRTAQVSSTRVPVSDVSVAKTSGASTYIPGSTGSFTVTVANAGPGNATGVGLTDSAPAGMTIGTWSCTASGTASSCPNASGSGNLNISGIAVGAGGSVTYTLPVTFAASLTTATLTNTATITVPAANGDSTPGNHSDGHSLTRDAQVNLALTLTPNSPTGAPTATYIPGSTANSLVVRVSNTGPSNSQAPVLTLTLPAQVSSASWSCLPANCTAGSGTGTVNVNLTTVAVGTPVDVSFLLGYASSATAATIDIAASVLKGATESEAVTSNNSATNRYTIQRRTDLGLSFTPASPTSNPTASYVPGTTGNALTLTVTNGGPSNATGAALALTLPPEVEAATWTCAACTPTNGTGNLSATINLASGATGSVVFALDYASNALTANLDLQANVTAGTSQTDPVAGNNSVTNRYEIDRQADIRVLKVRNPNVSPINPGTAFEYWITVTNLGPSDVGIGPGEQGALLTDDFSAQLRGDPAPARCGANPESPCWAYCPSDEGTVGNYTPNPVTCPATEVVQGAGDFSNLPFRLTAGSSSRLEAYVSIGGAASGTLSNTATVGLTDAGVTLLNPGTGKSSNDTVSIELSTDIRVNKTDGVTSAIPGTPHSYTITVTNDGFTTASGIRVQDTLPLFDTVAAGFVPGSISWQCLASEGACCNSNSTNCGVGTPTSPPIFEDLLNNLIDLPGQTNVVFTVTGQLHPEATGTLSNTATITLPSDVVDGNPANNTSTDGDTLLEPSATLTLQKSAKSVEPVVMGSTQAPFRLVYEILVGNDGPSFVSAASVVDQLNTPGLEPTSASWNCSVQANPSGSTACNQLSGGGSGLSTTVDLDPGGLILFTLTVDTNSSPPGVVTNTATISAGLIGSASDTIETGLIAEADLVIVKDDFKTTAVPGTDNEYTITVSNLGPNDVFKASITDLVPAGLDNVSWTCEATTPVPGDLAFLAQAGPPNTEAGALAMSANGRHAYVASPGASSVIVLQRENVPGFGFGEMAVIETEMDGANDPSDSGGAVSGMPAPLDLVLSSDGVMLYVISSPASGSNPGSIVSFSRATNAANPDHGRLSFAGALSQGMPSVPKRIIATNQNIYVSGDGVIAIYRIDQASRLPIFLATHSIGVPANPAAMAVSLSDSILFVGSSSAGVVSSFAINTLEGSDPIGSLSLLDQLLPDAELVGVSDLLLEPASRHLYVAAGGAARLALLDYTDAGVMQRRLTYAYAALTQLPEPPLPLPDALAGTTRLAISPDGEHLISVNRGDASLLQFRRDTQNGGLRYEALLRGAEHPALAGAAGAIVTSDGRHVVIPTASLSTRALAIYSRRAPDPLFAFLERDRRGDPLPNPPGGTLPGLGAPADVSISPLDRRHVYAVNLGDNSLTVFERNETLGQSDDSAGEHLQFLATYSQGQGGFDGLFAARHVQVSADGKQVFVSSEDGNSLAVFTRTDSDVDPNYGRLMPKQVLRDNQGGFDGLSGARGIALDSLNRHVYVAASFEAAIGIFKREANGMLSQVGVVRDGQAGVSGLLGVRDLVVSRDGRQLFAVGFESNIVTVFSRDLVSGALTFVQALPLGTNDGLSSISLPMGPVEANNAHVYVVASNSSRLYALRRVIDPGNPAAGTLVPLFQYANNQGGIVRMSGPRDVQVSPDGRRVYVAAQFGHSVLAFDRDTNATSQAYGSLLPLEVRSNGIDGVDGINSVYAITVSPDSNNIYAAGFGSNAIASFAVGTGSSCSSGGGGSINDSVDIGAGGTLVYRLSGTIRPEATGILMNTATVTPPPRVTDPDTSNNSSTDSTDLTPRGDLTVSKTNDRVSVVAGEPVTYEIEVRNLGPSNLVHDASNPITLTDLLSGQSGFDAASATWTCLASGSGALEFTESFTSGSGVLPPRLSGVSGVSLVSGGSTGTYIAAASVLDNSLNLFLRDPVDGSLSLAAAIAQGDSLQGELIDVLEGARSVTSSSDGRFVYVASRISDAVAVFELTDNGAGGLSVELVQRVQGVVGLDQALHLVLSPDGEYLYVAGANDNAIAVFERNDVDGLLTWIETEQNGVNDPDDAGGVVAGLTSVEFLAISPDGAHLYAVSGAGGSVALFNRSSSTGRLWFRNVRDATHFGTSAAGAASLVFDPDGKHAYLTAALANRVLVLARETNSAVPAFGNLTFASSVSEGVAGTQGLLSPRRAAMSSDGLHVYVTAQAGSSVAWFVRNDSSGALSFLGLRSNESTDVEGLGGATGLLIDGVTNNVYVAGTLDAAISQFARQVDTFCPTSGTGDLVDVPITIAAGGSVLITLTVGLLDGHTGTLSNTVNLSVPPGVDPDPSNNSAIDTDQVSLIADLAITKDDGLAEYDGLAGARVIVGDADHLYVAGTDDNAIGVFRVLRDPQPSAFNGEARFDSVVRSGQGGVTGLAAVADLLLSADGDHVYAASPSDNSVAAFSRNRSTGRLAFLEIEQNGILGVTGLSGARALAMSPDGSHVYAAGEFSNAIAIFTRDSAAASANYGRLTFKGMVQDAVGGVDGIGAPIALAVSPDGRHLYALGAAANSIAVFLRNPTPASSSFGLLTYQTRYLNNVEGFAGLGGIRSLLITSAGDQLLVLGAGDASVVRLSRASDTGQLAPLQRLQDGEAGTSGLAGANRLRWAPDRAQVLVAASASNALVQLDVAPDGALSFAGSIANGDPAPGIGGNVLGLAGLADVLVAPDGLNVYGAARSDAALSMFDRDAGTGELDFQSVLFDGLGGVAPGDAVTYIISAINNGPSDVVSAVITDMFPQEFTAVSWTCTSSFGAGCAPSGNGNIQSTVSLPVGGQVVFEATGQVAEGASGRLINTASIQANGVFDPNESNNSATDGDTVLSPAMNLVVSVDDGLTEAIPGGPVDYTVAISNLGPSYAANAVVQDIIPPALFNVEWSCEAFPIAGSLSVTQQIAAPTDTYQALVADSLGNHVYVAGQRGVQGIVTAYRRNPLDGSLTQIAVYQNGVNGVAGINGAADLVLSGDQRFVYVAGALSDAIAVFSRDTSTGLLSFVGQYQDGELGIDGLGGVSSLLFAPGGARLYAAGQMDDAIALFSVNPSTGLLTQSGLIRQTDTGVDGLGGVSDLAWNEGATHLFAVARANQSLAAFARNASTGQLTFTAIEQEFELLSGALADPVALTSNQNQIFVASAASNRVSSFQFDAGEAPGFTLDFVIANGIDGVSGMSLPRALRYETDQARLYVAAAGSGSISLFSLLGDAPALLQQFSPADAAQLAGVAALAFSHNGQQIYSAADDSAGGIAVLALARGSRCAIAGDKQLGSQTVDIAPDGSVTYSVRGDIFANALGELRYEVSVLPQVVAQELDVSNNSDFDVNQLQPAPDLSISKTDGLTEVVAGLPLSYRIDVANAGVSDALLARVTDLPPLYLFPAVTAGVIPGEGAWRCDANLPLEFDAATTSAQLPELAGVTAMALSSDAQTLFAVSPSQNALLVIPRLPDGSFSTPQVIQDDTELGETTVSGMAGASNLALTADGRHLFVTSALANSLLVFERLESGELSFAQKLTSGSNGVAGLLGAAHVVVSKDGTSVFVAAPQSNAIAAFRRDAVSGVITFVERVADGLGTIVPDSNVIRGVRRLHLSEDGAHLYAVATTSAALSHFSVNPATSGLTYRSVRRAADAGLGVMAQARDLLAAPGDSEIYVLGTGGIALFDRAAAAGTLTHQVSYGAIPGLDQPTALARDTFGSRLYLSDAVGAVHVFARDWNGGALDHRFSLDQPADQLAGGNELIHLEGLAALYLSSPQPGAIAQIDELALSRCLDSAGSEAGIERDIDLGVGGWAEFELDLVVHPSARGVLENEATVLPAAGADPSPADNTGIDQTTIIVVSDIGVSKSGPATGVAGEAISYLIEVTNAGPSDALGLQVVDALHPAVINATWSCVPSGGSQCPASGNGSPAFAADVLVGDTLTITIDATIASSFVGTLPNRVELVPEAGASDPTPGDHAAEVATEVIALVDVAIDKSNGVDSVVAGDVLTYTLTVSNSGPSDAPQVRVRDQLPEVLTTATWTCSGTNGASCPAMGAGSPDFIASLPASSQLTLLIEAQLQPTATGELLNTASAQVLGEPFDTDPANDSASDSDVILIQPDLQLSLVDPLDPFDPGGSIALPYRVVVSNAGPSNARNVVVDLVLSAQVTQTLPSTNCGVLSPQTLRCAMGEVASGREAVIELAFTGLPSAPGQFVVDGLVTTSDDDPQLANNVASQTTTLIAGGDVMVSLDNGRNGLETDEVTTYELRVVNIGSQAVADIVVETLIPLELIDASWTCSGIQGGSCSAGGSGDVADTISLAAGQGATYLITARVDPALDQSTPQTVVLSASASVPPGSDINLLNNTAVETDDVVFVIFRDSFESASALLWGLEWLDVAVDAQACSELRLSGERRPHLAGMLPVRLAEGISSSGTVLLMLDVQHRYDGDWLRLSQRLGRGAEGSAWVPWRGQSLDVVVRLEAAGLGLLIAGETAWHAPLTIDLRPARWRVLPGVQVEQGFQATARSAVCGAASNSGALQ